MKKIHTVTGFVTLVDDDVFKWASKRKWYVHHSQRRGDSPYVHDGKNVLSRLITETVDPLIMVDHKDGNTLDNRRSNLRPCTHLNNFRNRKAGNGRRFKGTYKTPNAWAVKIQGRHIGTFPTEEEAARAYDAMAAKIYGEFARLNFPK